MNLPKIDLSSLPDLDTLTGLFGSLLHASRIVGSDDSIVTLMAFVYETTTRWGALASVETDPTARDAIWRVAELAGSRLVAAEAKQRRLQLA